MSKDGAHVQIESAVLRTLIGWHSVLNTKKSGLSGEGKIAMRELSSHSK